MESEFDFICPFCHVTSRFSMDLVGQQCVCPECDHMVVLLPVTEFPPPDRPAAPAPTVEWPADEPNVARVEEPVPPNPATPTSPGLCCIVCNNGAHAVCKFCGRAVCRTHIQDKRFISGFTPFASVWRFQPYGVSINDAVWCGQCHPEYQQAHG